MAADPRDDFASFDDHRHMFFHLADPFGFIREQVTTILTRQVEDAKVKRIAARGEPKWLTLGRPTEDEGKVQVGHYAFCFESTIEVTSSGGDEALDATLTFLFRDIDRKGDEDARVSIDFGADAAAAFDDNVFKSRFLAFRG